MAHVRTRAHRKPHATAGVARGRALCTVHRVPLHPPRPDACISLYRCVGALGTREIGKSKIVQLVSSGVSAAGTRWRARARAGASETRRAPAGREERRVKDEGTLGRKGDGKAPEKMGRGGMRAVLEGGAVGGEKSRTPPRPERSICSTYPGSQPISTYAHHRRPVKIAQSMTSKRTFAPVVR